MKIAKTDWYPEKKLIVTHISGEVDIVDIEAWEHSLLSALNQVDDNDQFKIFVNLHGFKAVDLEAHKRFRSIVPQTLAKYGWKVGYVHLFEEEAKHIQYRNSRGICCIAAAHAHQDETKIEQYELRFGRSHEHFFTDPSAAQKWIESVKAED